MSTAFTANAHAIGIHHAGSTRSFAFSTSLSHALHQVRKQCYPSSKALSSRTTEARSPDLTRLTKIATPLRDALTEPLTEPASQGALRGKPERFGDSRQRSGLVFDQADHQFCALRVNDLGKCRSAGFRFRSISDLSERVFVVRYAARTNGSVKQNIAPRWRFSAQMVPP